MGIFVWTQTKSIPTVHIRGYSLEADQNTLLQKVRIEVARQKDWVNRKSEFCKSNKGKHRNLEAHKNK